MSNHLGQIYFHYLTPLPSLRDRKKLKAFIAELIKSENKTINTVNYIFCTDDYLLGFNQKYLTHDTYTDILTFELSSPSEPLLSDIYISVERVRENAMAERIPLYHELLRVAFHGALHLCGYRDKTKREKKLMRSKEDCYIHKYLVSRETAKSF